MTSVIAVSSLMKCNFNVYLFQLDEQLQGAVEVIGQVERDCTLLGQRIVPYSIDFGEL